MSPLTDGLYIKPWAFQGARSILDTTANAILAAAGYNFGLLLRWREALLRALIQKLLGTDPAPQSA